MGVGDIHTVVTLSFLQNVHICGGQAGPGVIGRGEGEAVGGVKGQGDRGRIWHSIFESLASALERGSLIWL